MEKSEIIQDLPSVNEHLSCTNYMIDTSHGFHYEEFYTVVHEKNKVLPRNLIMFIIKGGCSFSYNQYSNREFLAGEMFFIPKKSIITGEINKGTKLIYMAFDVPLDPRDKQHLEHLWERCKEITYNFVALKMNAPLIDFVHSLVYYFRNGGNCIPLHEIKHKELFLILRLFYTKDQFAGFFHPIVGRNFDFKNFVLENYETCNKLGELIVRSNICPNSFMRKFKNEFGISGYQWILRQKCQKIQYKASQSGTTIQDIMAEIGVVSPTHFNRICKRCFNKTPKELITFYQDPL